MFSDKVESQGRNSSCMAAIVPKCSFATRDIRSSDYTKNMRSYYTVLYYLI